MISDEEIIERAEKFYERVQKTCAEIHKEYHDEIDFGLLGKQWEGDAAKERGSNRLTLTVNRLRQYIYQVVNDFKKSEMTSKVLPHDTSEKDKKLAEVRRGIMRSLERKKGGLSSYNNAAKTLVGGGLGGWRILTDYVSPESFDEQEIKFQPIEDMGSVLVDFEDIKEPDCSDMRDCMVTEQYSNARFEATFKKDPKDFMSEASMKPTVWGNKEGPVVSDYWFKHEDKDSAVLLSPIAAQLLPKLGRRKSMYRSDLEKLAKDEGVDSKILIAAGEDGKPKERETTRCKVYCAKLAGKQVVKTQEWPIDLIPVVIVQGRRTVNRGSLVLEGLTRQSRDAQKSYNYLKSNKTERIAEAPRVPIWVPRGGIPKDRKRQWANATNEKPFALEYNVYDDQNRPIPPPRREDPVNVDSALVEEERQSVDEIKATVGMYDAAVGNRSNESSGVAITARAQESDTTNYDFKESMVIGIKYSTKVINLLLKHVYDTERQVSMVGEDDKETVVMVNAPNPDGSMYSMDDGEFDVDYEAGPSSATKGQDIRDNLTAIFQAVPGTVLPLGSEYIRNSEMRNADMSADRFEKWANTQVPGLYEDKNQGQVNPQMVAQLQSQLQQMQERLQQIGPQLQQLQQENAKLSIENQAVKSDKSLEAERIRIEWFKAKTDAEAKNVEGQVKTGTMALKAHDQEHDQRIENAKIVHEVHQDHKADASDRLQQAHDQKKDTALIVLQAHQQGHGQQQDREKLGLEGRKLDQAKDAGSTGGIPGNPPTPGVKR